MSHNRTWVLSKRAVFLMALAVLAFVLTACGGRSSITGKWEQISGELPLSPVPLPFIPASTPGTLWEFFEDGTVYIGWGMEMIEGEPMKYEYSQLDKTHLEIKTGQIGGMVYELAQSGDEITLKHPSTQSAIVLKPYREFSTSPDMLAGDWEKVPPYENQCFRAFGLDFSPQTLRFGREGSFSAQQEGGFFHTGISLSGQSSISGGSLHIRATGTKTEAGLFRETRQIKGELTCQITISYSRLLFRDGWGRETLYVRAGLR